MWLLLGTTHAAHFDVVSTDMHAAPHSLIFMCSLLGQRMNVGRAHRLSTRLSAITSNQNSHAR
jgi:hypothetical protein